MTGRWLPNTVDRSLAAGIVAVTLAALCAVALVDLPFIHHPDEPTNLAVLHTMIRDGSSNPEFFNYPSLLFYVNGPGQILAGFLSDGDVELSVQSMGSAYAPTVGTMLFARGTSLAAHIACVLTVFVFLRTRIALPFAAAGALLTGLSPLTLSFAPWMAPDVFATLFVTLCLCATARIVETGSPRDYALAGVFAGLAAASKYNVGAVALAVAIAAMLAPGGIDVRTRLLARAALASMVALALGSPYLFIDMPHAVSGLILEMHHYRTGHVGAEGETLRFNLRLLGIGMGTAVLFAVAAASDRALKPIMIFAIAYFCLLSAQSVRFERNLAPLVPAISILAAIGAARVASRLPWGRMTASVIAVVLIVPVYTTFDRVLNVTGRKPELARYWIEDVVPADAHVVAEAYTPFLQERDRQVRGVRFAFPGYAPPERHSYLVLSRSASLRFAKSEATRVAFAQWLAQIDRSACGVSAFPEPGAWRVLVYEMGCDGGGISSSPTLFPQTPMR